MIYKGNELKKDVVPNLMKGKGDINRTHILSGDDFHGIGRLYAIHTLAPGASIGFHTHQGEQESYYILEGTALYSNNGVEVEIGKGDVTLCPSGEGHSIENIGDSDLVFVGLIYNVIAN